MFALWRARLGFVLATEFCERCLFERTDHKQIKSSRNPPKHKKNGINNEKKIARNSVNHPFQTLAESQGGSHSVSRVSQKEAYSEVLRICQLKTKLFIMAKFLFTR